MGDQLSLQIDEGSKLQSVWGDALELVERKIGREAVESWLRDATPLSLEEGTFVLNTASGTARTWIEKKYARAFGAALSELTGHETRVEVVSKPVEKKGSKERP